MFPLRPGGLPGGLLCRNRFIIENGIIRILDCLAGQQDWGENEDGNGVQRAVCSKTGGCKHGGGVGNKGSGLDVGTPRCSCWIGTRAAVCLSQDDVMAASCPAHRLSQHSPLTVGTGAGFPAGPIRYTEQTSRYCEDDVIAGGVMSASQSPSPSFVPVLQLKRCRHWVKSGTSCASSVTAATSC